MSALSGQSDDSLERSGQIAYHSCRLSLSPFTMTKTNEHIGSKLDDFLADEGVLDAFRAKAIEEVAAWRLAKSTRSKTSGNPKPRG